LPGDSPKRNGNISESGCKPRQTMFSFAGKTAVITGSTSGIGEATARLIADRGAEGVLLTGRSRPRGEEVARSIRSRTPTEVVFVAADLGLPDAYQQIIETADRSFGRIDILVNSAGTTARGSIESTTGDQWDEIMAINVRSPFFLIKEAVRIMRREERGGTIVNVGSVAAHGGPPHITPYSVSKAALAALTRNVAYAVMRDGIRVIGGGSSSSGSSSGSSSSSGGSGGGSGARGYSNAPMSQLPYCGRLVSG